MEKFSFIGLTNRQHQEIKNWCFEMFSPVVQSTLWDSYQNTKFNESGQLVSCSFFRFYILEDAMAFKLRWA